MTGRDQDSDLRAAFAARRRERFSGEPPSADELWALATGELRGDRAARVLDYIEGSAAGAAEWKATVELVREAGLELPVPDEEPRAATRRAPSRFGARWWIGWTAAAAAAAAIAFLVLRPGSDRDPDVPAVTRATPRAEIEAVGPDRASRDQPLELRWRGGPEQAYYDVRILDEDLETVHTVYALTTPAVTVPGELLAKVEGDVLFWQVVATVEGGERIESATFTVRLTR